MADIIEFPKAPPGPVAQQRHRATNGRKIASLSAARMRRDNRQHSGSRSNPAETRLRPIFVKAHRGEIARLLVVYQERPDSPPVLVCTDKNHEDAIRMAMQASARIALCPNQD